jgi:hypothetical protein
MKKTVVTLLIAFFSITAYCQKSYVQNLGGIASITFPDTPKSQKVLSGNVYILPSNGVLYFAQTGKAEKNVKDMLNSDLLDTVYNGLIKGTMIGSGGKLDYQKKINLNGVIGVEFGYKAHVQNKIFYCCNQAFYLNNLVVIYALWSPNPIPSDDKTLKSFFSTFKITLEKGAIRQSNASDIGFFVGTAFAKILAYGILVAIILGVAFLVRRSKRKRLNLNE